MKRLRSFEIGNHTVRIRYQKKVINDEGKPVSGMFNPAKNMIYVATEGMCEDLITHSLWHEVSHCMMILLNQWKLNADETFIDTHGLMLAQIMKTIR